MSISKMEFCCCPIIDGFLTTAEDFMSSFVNVEGDNSLCGRMLNAIGTLPVHTRR